MYVLVNYIGCLKKYKNCLFKFILYFYLEELFRKLDFVIFDFLDKSENKVEDMISILENIYINYILRIDDDNLLVIKKKVFGGDVLINERVYLVQFVMLNGQIDFERFVGVVYRLEGLY